MPLSGIGITPGAGAVYNELSALTRRAFIPRVTTQIYYSTPTIMMLLGNAQKVGGGVNQITVPVQGNSMVQGSWTSYSGTFNKPQVIPGVQNAQYSVSYFTVPVPLVLGEALIQSTEAVIPILDVRMNDVYAVTAQQIGSAAFTNNSANPLMPQGLVDAYDNGTNVNSYGGISRTAAGNGFWQGQYYNASGNNILNRATLAQYLIQVTDNAGGEAPDMVIMSPSDYATLNSSFIGTEQTNTNPGQKFNMDTPVRSSFPNLEISGVPFFLDHWCPKGTMYMINSRYTAMYLSEDAPFAFSGFYSAIPLMQIAQIGVMILGYNIVCAKPSSGAIITNFTGGAF